MPDTEVLAYATREKRAVLTLNRLHFIRLHRQQINHAGIIVCTFDPDFNRQGERIHEVIAQRASLAGQLLRVNRP
jgi:hypothetical protein